jgi:hypothetical protein
MKSLGFMALILIVLGCWGCMSVDHTTVIDSPESGYASGQFRDVRQGKVSDFGIFGAGAGAAAASGASALMQATGAALTQGTSQTGSSGGGGGMVGLRVYPGPTQGDPRPFAKSIAMINYSKTLKRITYDEAGGVIEYEFDHAPIPGRSSSYQPPAAKPRLPSSFGYQPVE